MALIGAVLCSTTAMAQAACPKGQLVGPDTHGHCCWPAQAWSQSRNACVGVPQCGSGFQASGENCVATLGCPPAQAVSVDTAGRCCWLGQVWSASRHACVGVPTSCPPGAIASGDNCVVAAPTSTPPQYTPQVPQAPPLAAVGGATTHFSGSLTSNIYTVRAQGQTCTTPCTLTLTPGSLTIDTTGAGAIHRSVSLPPGASKITLQHFTLKELIFSVVLVAIGLPMMGGGIYLGDATHWSNRGAAGIGGIVLTTAGATLAFGGVIGFLFLKGERVDVTPASPYSAGASSDGARITF